MITIFDIDELEAFSGFMGTPDDVEVKLAGRRCPLCKLQRVFTFPAKQVKEYRCGALARDCFDSLAEEDIEQLLTGFHPDSCQGEESARAYVEAIQKLQDRLTKVLSNA